jgi:SOS-response transcriptional repressor LexA
MATVYTDLVCPRNTTVAIPRRFLAREKMPMGYLDNLAALRKRKGFTQASLAERLGVEQPTVQRWEAGKREPDLGQLLQLAEVLEVHPGTLLDDGPIALPGAEAIREVPLLGVVPAGNWREAVRRSSNTVPVPARDAPRDAYALTVEGDSMDLHVPDGFTIVIDPSDVDLFAGRLFVVMNEDGETTFKEYREGPARLVPASSNPAHKEIPISGGGFRILGRVVWSGKRHV